MRYFVALVAALVLAASAAATPLPLAYPPHGPWWVSTTGNDSTGNGTQANPWATIGKARDYIRTNNLNGSMIADLVVNVRAGTYRVTTPIVFGAADSGSGGHVVDYVSYDGPGQAILDGGTVVSGWVLDSGSTYKAAVSGSFWTVYENDIRSDMARTPNRVTTVGFPMARAPYFLSQSASHSLTVLTYSTSDISPGSWSTTDAQIVIWDGGARNWLTTTNPIASINTGAHTITFSNQSKFYTYMIDAGQSVGNGRYFAQGDKSMLDVAGEWYHDQGANQLYYIARDGPIASQTIIVPTVQEVIQVFGTGPNQRASGLKFDGFAVAHTDFQQWYRSGYAFDDDSGLFTGPSPQTHIYGQNYSGQAPANLVGAVHLRNTDNVTITNMKIYDVGMYGVLIDGYGQQDTISNTWIQHVGLTGIRLNGNWAGEGDYVKSNIVSNDRVWYVGELEGNGSGIDITNSGSNLVQFCDFENGPRAGVWEFAADMVSGYNGMSYTRGNTIDHTKILNFDQDSGDTGCVTYSQFGSVTGSGPYLIGTANQVIINGCTAHSSMNNFSLPIGFYSDNETSGQVYTNVEVVNYPTNPGRWNDSDTPALTNCSFLSDGTLNGSFNAGLMDTANIGTTSGFPYP